MNLLSNVLFQLLPIKTCINRKQLRIKTCLNRFGQRKQKQISTITSSAYNNRHIWTLSRVRLLQKTKNVKATRKVSRQIAKKNDLRATKMPTVTINDNFDDLVLIKSIKSKLSDKLHVEYKGRQHYRAITYNKKDHETLCDELKTKGLQFFTHKRTRFTESWWLASQFR